jgi:hypothetical protein
MNLTEQEKEFRRFEISLINKRILEKYFPVKEGYNINRLIALQIIQELRTTNILLKKLNSHYDNPDNGNKNSKKGRKGKYDV